MLKKIIALIFLSFLLVSCGTKVVDTTPENTTTETNVEVVETEEIEETDPIIDDFINDLDALLESSEEDS